VSSIEHRINTWLYRLIIDSPKANILLLRVYLGGEDFHRRFPWFGQMSLIEDPELRLLMTQHLADEENHGKYFGMALEFKGADVAPPPLEMDALVQMAAGFWDAGILVGDDLNELTGHKLFTEKQNLFVQLAFKDLSEKRAISQFHIWKKESEWRDPETYAILKRVVEDEDWHVRIFDDQVHKFMSDPVDGAKMTAIYKRLVKEAKRVTRLTSAAFLNKLLDDDMLVTATKSEKRFLRFLAWITAKGAGELPMASAHRLMELQAPIYGQAPPTPAHA
jgi:hypothetical protein